jgi:MYXO-CTERM domain-containing protein
MMTDSAAIQLFSGVIAILLLFLILLRRRRRRALARELFRRD